MKKKTNVVFLILLLFFSILFVLAQFRVMDLRSKFNHRLNVTAAPIPSELLKALAGEFKGVVANYLLLEAASFVGGNTKVNEKQWDAVVRILDRSSILDPYFKQTYILTQGILPWQAQRVEPAMLILERSKKHRTWDWLPGFLIGFNSFYFQKDNARASQELMQASKIPGAPVALATWASRLASKVGQTQAAIDFLTAVYEETEDEHTKRVLEQRLMALKGVKELQSAIERFEVQFGRIPETLEELESTSIISAIPPNPYGRTYVLKDGQVEF